MVNQEQREKINCRANRMNKQSIIACLFLIFLLPHFSYSYETPPVYQSWTINQKFSKKSLTENILGTYIAQAVPIAAPLVALGKFIASWIKNRKNNRAQHNASSQLNISTKKQEPVFYPTVETTLPEKLSNLRSTYKKYRKLHTNYCKRLSERIRALQQSLSENLQCSLQKTNWSNINPTFVHAFNLNSSTFDLNGIQLQHVLQKEFRDIVQKTALAWTHHRNNTYIQQLVEKNITCIKIGIAHNQSGKVIEAARFADIGWAILDHIQALGKGVCQGTSNIIETFFHPIETIQGAVRNIAQCTYYLGQATLEAIDLSILAVTDQNAARKKLQTWKQNFIELADTISEQWRVTSSHDITQLVTCFATEIFLTGKAFHGLDGLFSFARINSTKLIGKAQKVTESVPRVTTSEGITTCVNKAVKHTQYASKTEHTTKRGTTKLKKTGKPIQARFEQRLQSRQSTKTRHITEQRVTELRKKRPEGIKKRANQRRFHQSIKTYEDSLNNNNLKSNIIKKKFKVTEKMKDHIFSKKHKDKGILNLGKNESTVTDKFINIVRLADHKGLLKDGPNQIHTIIKNHKVVLRAFVKEGEILMLNGFIEDNVNYIGNTFELLVKEYRYG